MARKTRPTNTQRSKDRSRRPRKAGGKQGYTPQRSFRDDFEGPIVARTRDLAPAGDFFFDDLDD